MKAGRLHGQKQALIDGGLAGWTKGVELGMEVSHYLVWDIQTKLFTGVLCVVAAVTLQGCLLTIMACLSTDCEV